MNRYTIDATHTKSTISREIYGQFSEHLGRCIYNGVFVGKDSPIPNVNGMRTDLVEALRKIQMPVLRWPGGCFADEYHWKDGIGPLHTRKRMVNNNWGGVVEDNSFGTHEFLELCRQIGCEPYINGNMGSGTVQEMAEWVEYMTADGISPMSHLRAENGQGKPWNIRYFGVGNENWGCGGNMRPAYYADLYRRYQTFLRNFGENRLYKIACGPNVDDYAWMETLMSSAANKMDGISMHYYTVLGKWDKKGSATCFTEDDWYTTLNKALHMDELVTNHAKIMDRYDPQKRVGLIVDEWGSWYDVEPGTNPGFLYQQNTMRDALIAAITLNIFNKHSDRVKMANLAQLVNVLQSLVLTEGEKMLLTPTYHIFDLYQAHQEGALVESYLETEKISAHALPNLHESASIDRDGVLHVTVANLSTQTDYKVDCTLLHKAAGEITTRVLRGNMGQYNSFEEPTQLRVVPGETVEKTSQGFRFTIPAHSVTAISIR